MPRLLLEPMGTVIDCPEGETIFAAAQRCGVLIPTACVGRGTCGLCRVKVLQGGDALSQINATERRHLGNNYFLTQLRLSCQAQLQGDVQVRIPDARPNASSTLKLNPKPNPKLK